jgi:hypothetical protein
MKNNEIIYSLEGHNSKYGVCEHRCQNGVWLEVKNCCCGPEGDDWHNCGNNILPFCDSSLEGLVVYTNCYRENK